MTASFARLRTSHTMQAISTAVFVVALNALIYIPPVYRRVGADTVLWINNLTSIGAAFLSVWLAARLWLAARRGESLRKMWGSLLVGLILWAIAELIWDSYQLILNVKLPSTSVADVAWIAGYIALIVGLSLRIYTFRMRPTKAWQYAVLAISAVLASLAVIYVIVPILSAPESGVPYDKFTGLFYAVGDVILAFLALFIVLVLKGGLLSRPWTAIALACFGIGVSDLLYAFASAHGIYQVDPSAGLNWVSYVIDTSYTFAYVLMALGLYLQARLLDAI